MLDVLVELRVRWGDGYTVAIVALPLALLGLAWALRRARAAAAATAVLAVLLVVVAAPAYGEAREECERVAAAGFARPGNLTFLGSLHGYVKPPGRTGEWIGSESLRTGCYHLLR